MLLFFGVAVDASADPRTLIFALNSSAAGGKSGSKAVPAPLQHRQVLRDRATP
jgi:hypothetical protein